ncbi:hypothetical protein H696_05812 [Fonticula alba]|uniref:Uncharacterized protein n=1 Tax=Fonticula alba TaxID=691883 RepID=A0A058Z0A6_FONAL|nr:hypothetical protein H696_05812 [Fonticula alba]KCV67704.1 hypothetical protein H696_05812 [Fonticula alba]|eukprot:XP_009497888.1 hypothetical protein H696_05812 [Fonticula alba]
MAGSMLQAAGSALLARSTHAQSQSTEIILLVLASIGATIAWAATAINVALHMVNWRCAIRQTALLRVVGLLVVWTTCSLIMVIWPGQSGRAAKLVMDAYEAGLVVQLGSLTKAFAGGDHRADRIIRRACRSAELRRKPLRRLALRHHQLLLLNYAFVKVISTVVWLLLTSPFRPASPLAPAWVRLIIDLATRLVSGGALLGAMAALLAVYFALLPHYRRFSPLQYLKRLDIHHPDRVHATQTLGLLNATQLGLMCERPGALLGPGHGASAAGSPRSDGPLRLLPRRGAWPPGREVDQWLRADGGAGGPVVPLGPLSPDAPPAEPRPWQRAWPPVKEVPDAGEPQDPGASCGPGDTSAGLWLGDMSSDVGSLSPSDSDPGFGGGSTTDPDLGLDDEDDPEAEEDQQLDRGGESEARRLAPLRSSGPRKPPAPGQDLLSEEDRFLGEDGRLYPAQGIGTMRRGYAASLGRKSVTRKLAAIKLTIALRVVVTGIFVGLQFALAPRSGTGPSATVAATAAMVGRLLARAEGSSPGPLAASLLADSAATGYDEWEEFLVRVEHVVFCLVLALASVIFNATVFSYREFSLKPFLRAFRGISRSLGNFPSGPPSPGPPGAEDLPRPGAGPLYEYPATARILARWQQGTLPEAGAPGPQGPVAWPPEHSVNATPEHGPLRGADLLPMSALAGATLRAAPDARQAGPGPAMVAAVAAAATGPEDIWRQIDQALESGPSAAGSPGGAHAQSPSWSGPGSPAAGVLRNMSTVRVLSGPTAMLLPPMAARGAAPPPHGGRV